MPDLPTIEFSEPRQLTLEFGIQLYDAFTRETTLRGEVVVEVKDNPTLEGSRRFRPLFKPESGAFLFFDLAPGDHTITVRSAETTPYYLPIEVDVTLPLEEAEWPVFPERAKADTTKAAWDDDQETDFKAQLEQVTLRPTTAYPFPRGATLVRGTVLLDGTDTPIAQALVARQPTQPRDVPFTTAEDGEFVLFFRDLPYFDADKKPGKKVTLEVTHSVHTDLTHELRVKRGQITTAEIEMQTP